MKTVVKITTSGERFMGIWSIVDGCIVGRWDYRFTVHFFRLRLLPPAAAGKSEIDRGHPASGNQQGQ